MEVTKSQIIEGASFDLKIGNLSIIEIQKDGYGEGIDIIRTSFGDAPYADTIEEITAFINENI